MPSLKHSLGVFPCTALVIGSVIGSGVFVSTAGMAKNLPHTPLLLTMWIVGGVMTLFGALSLLELAQRMPKTGGPYEYFREIFGPEVAFFYGWATFMIAGAGGIAGVAFLCAHYFEELYPLYHMSPEWEKTSVHLPFLGDIFPFADMGVKLLAAGIVIFLSGINVLGVKLGAALQSFSTTTKTLVIVGIIGIVFTLGKGNVSNYTFVPNTGNLPSGSLIAACFLALSSAFWAYDGWLNLSFIAGEVKNPAKTIPRAMLLALSIIITIYLIINFAYFYVLPVDQIAAVPGGRVASAVMSHVVGKEGALFLAALIVFSAFDCTNASILTYARLYYAMGTSGEFVKSVGTVHPKYNTPHYSLGWQCAWVLVLLFTGSFDLVTSMYVFINWLFYLLLAVGVLTLWRRGTKVGLPLWIPIVFCLFTVTFLIMTLVGDIQAYQAGREPIIKSAMGLMLVLSGVPFYFYWRQKK